MRLLHLIVALVCAAPVGAAAQNAPPAGSTGPATILGSQNFRVHSKYVDQVFSIDVAAPPAKGPPPVVYVLDGNGAFGLAWQAIAPMNFGGDLPPIIVVGIGYELTNPYDVVFLRTRDLTPTDSQPFVDRMVTEGRPLPEGIRPGGADAFLEFINEELKPFIAARYEVDPGNGAPWFNTSSRRPRLSEKWSPGAIVRARAR